MVALVVDAVLSLHNIREVATSVQWVSHTNEVLTRLEVVLSTLKDAETGQRGYLLTGERPIWSRTATRSTAYRGSSPTSGSSPSTTRPRPYACCGSISSRASSWPSCVAGSISSRSSPTGRGRSRPRDRRC